MNFELRLKTLYKQKLAIQKLEEELNQDKKQWQELGEKVRSNAQLIYEMKEKLFESI